MKRILTGDRPTGKLHIGHYFGSHHNRIKLQYEYETYFLIANIQALSDNFDNPQKVRESIDQLLLDYYAIGFDFEKSNVYLQSESPEVNEVFIYLANFATVQQIMQNPTIKQEFALKGFEKSTPLGFFIHPIHQVADILFVNADLVPVGKDQAPMVEFAAGIARHFNKTYNVTIFKEPQALFGVEKNVPGIDGNAKMSKSLNNAIYLSDTFEELSQKIKKTKTDHERKTATDFGKPENSVVFTYLDLLSGLENNISTSEVESLKKDYRDGKLGDGKSKDILLEYMEKLISPIREKRKEGESKIDYLRTKALEGSKKVSSIAKDTLSQMKEAMMIKF